MSKHTPGPWRVCVSDEFQSVEIYAKQWALCRMYPSNHAWVNEEAEANARLMAAGPELLDRLYECLGYLEADNAPIEFVNSIKATVAKAEGKE